MATFNAAFVVLGASNTPTALGSAATVKALGLSSTAFFKLWIYPGTAATAGTAGGLVVNAQTIWVGKSSTVQPDPLAPTVSVNGVNVNNYPLEYQTQINLVTGEPFPFDLLNVYITGTSGDGVYIVWT